MTATETTDRETSPSATAKTELVITGYRKVGESLVPIWGWRPRAVKAPTSHEDDYQDDDRTRGATEIGD